MGVVSLFCPFTTRGYLQCNALGFATPSPTPPPVLSFPTGIVSRFPALKNSLTLGFLVYNVHVIKVNSDRIILVKFLI